MINVVFVICAHIFVPCLAYLGSRILLMSAIVCAYFDLFLYLRYHNGWCASVCEWVHIRKGILVSFHKFNYCGFREIHVWAIEFYFISTITVELLQMNSSFRIFPFHLLCLYLISCIRQRSSFYLMFHCHLRYRNLI